MLTEPVPWRIVEGDCRVRLREMPAESVHTVITSPPYFGLRDYGTGQWEGGDPDCVHAGASGRGSYGTTAGESRYAGASLQGARNRAHVEGAPHRGGRSDECRCGARRVDQQIGLEPTPDEFVEALVAVFREVRRVLRDDGTVWLNLGDSYNAYNGNRGAAAGFNAVADQQRNRYEPGAGLTVAALKPKDLIGIPWMVAFALRADGWYLRAENIWHKLNPMPESVTDRPTRAHEHLFLLTKRPRYFYDADAIREGYAEGSVERIAAGFKDRYADAAAGGYRGAWGGPNGEQVNPAGRNKRSVWTVATRPYEGAHFATFPPDLIEPCVLAGAPERACGECGAPWRRITSDGGLDAMLVSERPQQRRAAQLALEHGLTDDHLRAARATGAADVGRAAATQNGVNATDTATLAAEAKQALAGYFREFVAPLRSTTGWATACAHDDDDVGPGVVLDPFAGAGTAGLVAIRNRRAFVGIELNAEYAAMARERIATDIRLGHRSPQRAAVPEGQPSLFGGDPAPG